MQCAWFIVKILEKVAHCPHAQHTEGPPAVAVRTDKVQFQTQTPF